MIFTIIILALVGAVAFFHYVQGFFSAAISALLVVLAAMMAVSYHEPLTNVLLAGKMADQGLAISLTAIFASVYIVLRLVFDKLIPGNVRLPVIADKVGAAVMGLVAGVYAVGVVAIAAQTLPFGPSIAGYSRYPLADRREVVMPALPGRDQRRDGFIEDELDVLSLTDTAPRKLVIPVDDIVLGTAAMLSSDIGSMAGARPLASIHPDYLQELFGARIGIQVGANRTALNQEGRTEQVTVEGAFRLDSAGQADQEPEWIRQGGTRQELASTLRPGGNQVILVVRTVFHKGAEDTADRLFRFSSASARLVAAGKNYFPIGTFDGGRVWATKPDDFLFVDLSKEDRGADLVYLIEYGDAVIPDDTGDKELIAPGVFLEVKRMGRVDLSGMLVEKRAIPGDNVGVLRKPDAKPKEPAKPARAGATEAR
ncbi:MAG: CvpA family protein [Tepidisphaeraceae bacterium]